MGTEVKKCIIVSGAPNADIEYIKENINQSATIIAADSGYKILEKIGIAPDVIVGDFDSSDKPETNIEIITFPVEKEATDTFNSVQLAAKRGYNDITVLNALGGRIDHTYSNMLCLDYCNKNGIKCRIADRKNRLSLITGTTALKKEYQWFSLFAFLEESKGIKINGAHYDAGFFGLDAFDLMPGDQFAQSNYIENEECEISLDSGTLLLIESND